MFGSNTFGNNYSSPFGATQGLGFGAQPASQAPVGTTVRFQPLQGTDTVPKTANSSGPSQIQTRHQNICAMKEYESKSVDELRLEDYLAGRKVGQLQQTSAFGTTGFGTPQASTSQPSTSLFGTPSSQPSTNLFGTPNQNTNTGIFGQQQNTTSNLFNSSLNKPAGVTNSPFQIGSQPFSTATNTSIGGAQNTSFGLFSNNSTTTNTQGTAAPFGVNSTVNSPFSSTSIFSTPQNQANTSIFSNNLQNDANKSAFPQPQQTSSLFNFGPSTSNTSNLNNNATSVFAQQAKPNNLFSSPFNSNQPSTSQPSIFGTNSAQPATSQASIFGTPAPATSQPGTSIFGANTTQQPSAFGATSGFGATPASTTQQGSSIFGTQPQQQTTNLFGPANQSTNTSIFGQTNTSNLFNSSLNKPAGPTNQPFQTGSNLFGNNTTNTSIGGAQNTSFGSLGNTANNNINTNTNTQTPATQFGASTAVNSPSVLSSIFSTPQNQSASSIFANTLQSESSKPAFPRPTSPFSLNLKKGKLPPITKPPATPTTVEEPVEVDDFRSGIEIFVVPKQTNDQSTREENPSTPSKPSNLSIVEADSSTELSLISSPPKIKVTPSMTPKVGTPPQQKASTPLPQVGTPSQRVGTPSQQSGTPRQRVSSPLHQVGSPLHQISLSSQNRSEHADSMLVLFEDYDVVDKKRRPPKLSPKLNIIRTPVTVPSQRPKLRSIQIKPDLTAARDLVYRDASAINVAGIPKVRFINGSKLYCYLTGDKCVINQLNLLQTEDKKLVEKLDMFLRNFSMITQLEMQPALAPYIETLDFIDGSPSSDLLHAMYGPMQGTPYAKQVARKTRVIDWLANKNCRLDQPSNIYQLAIYYMSCNRYDLAADVLLTNNHPRLAIMVTTLNKDDIFSQLDFWRRNKADQHIDTEELKLFILLSGLTKWTLSNGKTINWLDGLEWTQQLCLFANHYTGAEKIETLSPLIKWVESETNDPEYHIIASHSPADVISAARSLEEQWFLLETLKSYQLECVDSDVIHCNLASQLVDLRWACFVALHIANNEARNQVLMKCLEQNVAQLAQSSIESWLIQNLKLPTNFIADAKALAH